MKISPVNSVLTVLLVLCFATAVSAQRTTGDVEGKVTDPNGCVRYESFDGGMRNSSLLIVTAGSRFRRPRPVLPLRLVNREFAYHDE